ncbi:YcaO-like family protein [Streptomyces sp. NPDC099088]|uniref:YcaO-like family protein n=1 Tax=Streptomyces sp. NPDC099088 TaxID=3366101 RepID=UPI003821C489
MRPIETKSVTAGTHRVCAPEVTLAWVRPFYERMGITRVADVTGLDDIGIPVFQAVRPNAKTLSVSQGKGVTAALAETSAVMESIEVWHAEEARLATVSMTVMEMAPSLPYDIGALNQRPSSVLGGSTTLGWVEAKRWGSGESVWVPEACIKLDSTNLATYVPSLFTASSNGLASGNTVEEAISHGVCELLERDALARVKGNWQGRLELQGIEGPPAMLLKAFSGAQVSVGVRDLSPLLGVPCFEAVIWSRSLPFGFTGSGCHLDKNVALCRALTEAAQSRLTLIAGSRDDISSSIYSRMALRRRLQDPIERLAAPARLWAHVPGPQVTKKHATDIDLLAAAVRRRTGNDPLVVNLSRPDIGIPVVKVLAPGLTESVSR